MDLYPWLLVIHVASMLIFFVAHGVSAAVALRLRKERDLARVRALLEISSGGTGVIMSAAFLAALATGVWLGFLGGFWGRIWIWASLGLLILIAILMTPMAAMPLRRIRAAAGIAKGKAGEIPPADEAEMLRLLERWNPFPTAAVGVAGLAIITWLMFFKPF